LTGIEQNERLFTGRLIDGAQSLEMGLVNTAEKADQVIVRAMALAGGIVSSAPVAVSMMKRSIYRGMNWDAIAAAEWEAHCQSCTFEMQDAKEGIAALLEKREPAFKGR
jgi:enoyl-CoA hydratase/carnithine racemase